MRIRLTISGIKGKYNFRARTDNFFRKIYWKNLALFLPPSKAHLCDICTPLFTNTLKQAFILKLLKLLIFYSAEPFDYEATMNGVIQFAIKASDSGNLSTTSSFALHIKDENDNPPEFIQILNFTVKEVRSSS